MDGGWTDGFGRRYCYGSWVVRGRLGIDGVVCQLGPTRTKVQFWLHVDEWGRMGAVAKKNHMSMYAKEVTCTG